MSSRVKLFFLISFLIWFSITGFDDLMITEPGKIESSVKNQLVDTNWFDRFYIGAMDCEVDYLTQYRNLDSLGFNLWHNYLGSYTSNGKQYPYVMWYDGSVTNDSLFTPVEDYAESLKMKIKSIYERNGGHRKLVMSRPKIDYLCYGQRSDYQCEPIPMDTDLWFYAFNYHHSTAPVEIDSGNEVIHCRAKLSNEFSDSSGYVVLGLRANTEQCKDEDGWRGDAQSIWIIKPRIRIDSSFANKEVNWNKPVCRVEVVNASNKLIKSFNIRVRNFRRDASSRYNGEYIEDFFWHNDTTNQIEGSWEDTLHWGWIYAARGDSSYWFPNHADIRVYWYGNCDMWIDYVRVDNDVADGLFKGLYDTLWIRNEVNIMYDLRYFSEPPVIKYYLELVEYNNLPCIGYVNRKVKEYSKGRIDIMQDLTYTISLHIPEKYRRRILNPEFLYYHYILPAGYTQVFAESYPLTACYTLDKNNQNFSKIPNTLPDMSGSGRDSILARYVPPELYENYLQDNINHKLNFLEGADLIMGTKCKVNSIYDLYQDQGNFRFVMQLCDSISKLGNIPFIFMPQIHQNFMPGEVRREPTNEELNMMTNVALTYGARGIMYFSYITWNSGDNKYVKGIVEDDNKTLRKMNFYHQVTPGKKETIISIVDRLVNKWGPLILSFDNNNRHSYIYDFEDERELLRANSCFEEFLTLVPDKGVSLSKKDSPFMSPVGFISDYPDKTYLQVATFGKEIDTIYYFMVVNRRCSPPNSIDTVAGRRRVQAKVRTGPYFISFPEWEVIDCESNNVVATFKPQGNLVVLNLGWFMPGEGKLFKIKPSYR